MSRNLTLICGRCVRIKGFHYIEAVEFLERSGVVTVAGSHERWRRHIVEKAPSLMDGVWGKRKTIFVDHSVIEPDLLPHMRRADYLPQWVVHAWLHSDEPIRENRKFKSQLALTFFRHEMGPIENVTLCAMRALIWNDVAEEINAERWWAREWFDSQE